MNGTRRRIKNSFRTTRGERRLGLGDEVAGATVAPPVRSALLFFFFLVAKRRVFELTGSRFSRLDVMRAGNGRRSPVRVKRTRADGTIRLRY